MRNTGHAGAPDAVSGGDDGARATSTGSYVNPVYEHDAPDPTVIRDGDGVFHCFTTQSVYGDGMLNMPHLISHDLVTWTLQRDAMPVVPAWASGSIWAPHVDRFQDRYVIYYCARLEGSEEHAIGVMTSSDLMGNFTDRGRPLVSRVGPTESTFSAIDPFALQAQDGRRILYWGSGHAPIRARELTADGLGFVGPARVVLEPFEGGGGYGALVEAAEVRYSPTDRSYYLWVSGDNTHVPHYAISEFRSTDPVTGFEQQPNPSNPVLSENEVFAGPGHHCLVADDAGQWWVLYHANRRSDLGALRRGDPSQTSAGQPGARRLLMLDKVDSGPDGWSVVNDGLGPSSDLRPLPVIHAQHG